MAKAVVDRLEVVDVDEQHRGVLLALAAQLLAHALCSSAPEWAWMRARRRSGRWTGARADFPGDNGRSRVRCIRASTSRSRS